MAISEACSAAEASGVQLDETVSTHPDKVSGGDGDIDSGHAEQIQDQQDLSVQATGGVSTIQKIQSLCEQAGQDLPTTIPEAQKLIAQGLTAIPENLVFSAVLTAESDVFKAEKEEPLSEVDKLRDELYSRLSTESTTKLAKLRQIYDSDIFWLKEKLRKSEERAYGLHD